MLKTLIITAMVAASAVAHAGTVATTKNEAGGIAVLTDEECTGRKNAWVAYSIHTGNKVLFGCWAMDDNFVFIRWEDGDVRNYPLNIWDIKTKKKGSTL